jgi:phage terminase large subunit GpA-like protein
VPPGPIVLTAGVDVQKDRLMYEVVGWAANKESWSIDAGALWGDTSLESTWAKLDELLSRVFIGEDGAANTISMLAVDSGYNTQVVYNWARQYPMSRVIAAKGSSSALKSLGGPPKPVEVNVNGKVLRRGYKVWSVGVRHREGELYGWLRLAVGDDGDSAARVLSLPAAQRGVFPAAHRRAFRHLGQQEDWADDHELAGASES